MTTLYQDIKQTMAELRPKAVRELVASAEKHNRPLPPGVSYDDIRQAVLETTERTQFIFWDRLFMSTSELGSGGDDARTIVMILAMRILKAEYDAAISAMLETVSMEQILAELAKMAGR